MWDYKKKTHFGVGVQMYPGVFLSAEKMLYWRKSHKIPLRILRIHFLRNQLLLQNSTEEKHTHKDPLKLQVYDTHTHTHNVNKNEEERLLRFTVVEAFLLLFLLISLSSYACCFVLLSTLSFISAQILSLVAEFWICVRNKFMQWQVKMFGWILNGIDMLAGVEIMYV